VKALGDNIADRLKQQLSIST